jgi:hypothetical protein
MTENFLTHDDLEMSLELLLCLTAGYQGSYVAQEILLTISHPANPIETLKFNKKMLDSIYNWNDQLLEKAVPILRADWSTPESEDARLAMKMLENLKLEHKEVYELASVVLNSPIDEISIAELGWCVAQFGRYTYCTEHYFRLLQRYAEKAEDANLKALCDTTLADKQAAMIGLNELVSAIQNGYVPPKLAESIMIQARRIPRNAKTTIHDIIVCYNRLKGNITFDMFDISPEQGAIWAAVGFGPVESSLWMLNEFLAPEEALEWMKQGFMDPPIAGSWNNVRILPAEAQEWISMNITPDGAKEWRKAGFSSAKAKVYIEKGMKRPPGRPRKE